MTHDPMCDDHHDGGDCPWCNFAARVREDERLRHADGWPQWCTNEIRRAALRDAVKAVSVMVIETAGNSAATVDQAVAAIEDLGGER